MEERGRGGRRRKKKAQGLSRRKGREKRRNVIGGKIEGERKRKGNGKKGKYIRGEAGGKKGLIEKKEREEKRISQGKRKGRKMYN
jgi:hypothetical protein